MGASLEFVHTENGPMEFNDLDKRMRVFETAHDHCVLPGLFIVAYLSAHVPCFPACVLV
jgi:hypothetical protein